MMTVKHIDKRIIRTAGGSGDVLLINFFPYFQCRTMYIVLCQVQAQCRTSKSSKKSLPTKGGDFFIDGVWNWYKVQTPLVDESHRRSTIKEAGQQKPIETIKSHLGGKKWQ